MRLAKWANWNWNSLNVGSMPCGGLGGICHGNGAAGVGDWTWGSCFNKCFTLAPVPGAIAAVGADPVFVDVTENLTIDLNDLRSKADQADVLMLSHMGTPVRYGCVVGDL